MQVCSVVIKKQLLTTMPGRSHKSFPHIKMNPLWNWEKKKMEAWIYTKQVIYERCQGNLQLGDDDKDNDEDNNECDPEDD